MKFVSIFPKVTLLYFATTLLLPPLALADQFNWQNPGTGSWFTGTNWEPGTVPTSDDDVDISNGGTSQVDQPGGAAHLLFVGSVASPLQSGLTINGGYLLASNSEIGSVIGAQGLLTVTSGTFQNLVTLNLGYSGTGIMNISGGLVTDLNSVLGASQGAQGTATVSGGTWQTVTEVMIGYQGEGILNVNGGLVTDGSAILGSDPLGRGTANVTSGTWQTSGALTVGGTGAGILNIDGGLVADANAIIASDVGSSGTANVTGGIWQTSGTLTVGQSGEGALNISGGLVHVDGTVELGITNSISGTGVGTVTLTGGVLETNQIAESAGVGHLILDGGVLRALSDNLDFLTGFQDGDVVLKSGGGIFDTNGHAIDFAAVLSGTGGVTKIGEGTLTLSQTNTYTGDTNLNAGTLRINGGHALGDGTLIINGGTVGDEGAGGTIANAVRANADFGLDAPTIAQGLTFTGDIDLGAGTRTITLSGPGLTTFQGQVTAGGLDLESSGVNPGSELILSGSVGNTINGVVIGGNASLGLNKDAGVFAVTGDVFIDSNGLLELMNSDQISHTSSILDDGNLVLSGSAQTNEINILVGTGNIYASTTGTLTVHTGLFNGLVTDGSGSMAIEKSTSGTLTLNGANTYTGGTTIDAGTLVAGNPTALGGGDVTVNSGASLVAGIAANQTLQIGGEATFNSSNIVFGELDALTSRVSVGNNLIGTGSNSAIFTQIIQSGTFALAQINGVQDLSDFTVKFGSSGATLGGVTIVDAGQGLVKLVISDSPTATGNDIAGFGPIVSFITNAPNVTVESGATIKQLTIGGGDTTITGGGLTLVQGTVNTGANNATFLNSSITTPGDFSKLGTGEMFLETLLNAGGNANVNAGILSVDGALTANEVIVAQGAFLKGHGVIFGDVLNNGHVAPGNSPGTLTIEGNYTQAKSGALDIEIASTSLFDRLIVNGNADLAGTLNFIKYDGFKFKYGQKFKFLEADSISGHFDSVDMPGHFRARLLEKHADLTLLVAPKSYVQVADTQNQKNVASALNSFIKAKHGDQEQVSIALDKQTGSEYPASFDQIGPNFYESLTNTTIELANGQNQILAQRLSAVRLGVKGFSAVGMEAVLANDKDGKSVLDAKGAKDVLAPTYDPKWGVWVQGNGIFAKVTNISDVPNYRYQSGGFTFGADYAWNEHFSTGVYSGYQGTYAKYGNNSSDEINQALFGGYATFQLDGFYSDAIVGGAYNGYQTRRSISFSTIDRTATATPNGGQFSTYVDAGYDWHVNHFTFGPLLAGQYTYEGVAPFTESGAQSLDLRVNQQNVSSLRMNVGGRVAYTWNLTDQIALIPEGRVFWQHEFLDNSQTIGASLNGGSGPGFNYQTANPGRDSVLATAGVSAQFGQRWNGNFYYTADFGNQSFISHMISAGLEWKF